MISAILLAAGQSQRMGDFKQLLTIEGETFVERCVDRLLASQAREVIVVTGHREAEVRGQLVGREVRFTYNPDYREGMSASIKCGVAAASDRSDAVLIALADQPLIEVEIIDQLIEVYRRERPLVVVPRYQRRNGHPIIMDMKLREEILSISPAQGLRQVRDSHSDQAVYVEVASETVLIDFDLPEDYLRIREEDRGSKL